MPYRKTGKPPGRPRKVKPPKPQPDYYVPPKQRTRARSSFRDLAERLNPSLAVQRYGLRPRRKPGMATRIA